jgi:signal transduction histidine kinase/CheY-like chemotaxis protein
MSDKHFASQSEDQRLKKLFELSKQLIASFELDTILQATVEGVAILSGLDTAAVYLIEGEQLRLCNTTPPLPSQFPEDLRYATLKDYPFIIKAIDTAAPVLIPDIADVVLTPEERSVVELRNTRTLLFLPLIAETEVMGALIVGSIAKTTELSNTDTEFANTLANFAALAVKNARLFQDRQRYAEELEQTLEERTRAEEERKNLLEQLIQAQKMDAIGRLAGGIAHDFNNLLSGIIGLAELLHMETKDENVQGIAREIVAVGERSAELTAKLLAFSRKGKIQIVSVDIHKIVREVVSILKHTLSRSISVSIELSDVTLFTDGDPAQIQSALLNLAVNARDAMPDGGELTIRTRTLEVGENCAQPGMSGLKPGNYIEITVADTGTGMDDKTLEHIYEPFYTTKEPGKGTGMGLSAVYNTMKSHNGAISLSSKLGQGTVFKLYFLKGTQNESESSAVNQFAVRSDNTPVLKHSFMKKICIIDDEVVVAKIAAEHLRFVGYDVSIFIDSTEAISFFRENHPTVYLVILDMIMPRMDGSATYYALKQIDPEVKIILSSGYSVNGTVQELLDDGAKQFIQKPFRRKDLIEVVQKVLQL